MLRVAIGCIVLVAIDCGSVAAPSEQPAATEQQPATTAQQPTTTTTMQQPATTTDKRTASTTWLVPSPPPALLRLVDATLARAADCGMADDCAQTVETASLTYDTDDLTVRRSLHVVQSRPKAGTYEPQPVDSAPQRAVGARRVHVIETAEFGTIEAAWTEPTGDDVRIDALGIEWVDLAAIIDDLRPVDEAVWPGVDTQEPIGRCVDTRSQLAPTVIPPGWQTFVLQAQPTGSCGQYPFLMMSLVLPGSTDGPGILVTITASPASEATPQPGEPVVVNGQTGTLQEFTTADGQVARSISVVFDTVAVEAHGNVDSDQLVAIVAGMQPVSDAEWEALVSSSAP
jgi:hypothetical protein